jgi:molybdopterin molybdotransferase
LARGGRIVKEPMIPVAEALARVLASAPEPLSEESLPLARAFGRVLARDVVAGRTQPPFANAAMDGYALRAADAATAPASLKLIGESAAGHAFEGHVGAGETTRIFTGAPMPEGADSVVIQEETRLEGDRVVVLAPAAAGDNVRVAGLDFTEGETVLRAGRRLGIRDVGMAAAAHHPTLRVRRRPRVAVLATGDELVSPGEPLGAAQIVASNNYVVMGLVEAVGGEAIDLGIAPDQPSALAESIAAARAARADVLVTIGGASVGDYDLVQKALTDAGMELGFWRIAMRPGKPLMQGRIGDMRVLGLPGNPTSSSVCALLFLRPLLLALLGDPAAGRDPTEPARLAVALPANGIRQDYMRAYVERAEDGAWVAAPLPDQDSSLVKLLSRSDALILRPPGAPPATAGDACRIIRWEAHGA